MKYLLLILFSITTFVGSAQLSEILDTVIQSRAVELGIIDVTVYSKQKDSRTDTIYLNEYMRFDTHGNVIENYWPYGRGLDRRVFKYDSLNRKIAFYHYDNKDTAKVNSERHWNYKDSTYTKETAFNAERGLTRTQITTVEFAEDTFWFHHDRIDHEFDRREKKTTRVRVYEDTLQVTEYIKYDDSLKIRDVDVYYKVNRRLEDGKILLMQGEYVLANVFDEDYTDYETIQDIYRNPEKYLKMQLDGAFEYEYHDPFTYQIYDSLKRIIQDGQGWSKKTFDYDQKGNLIRVNHWGQNEEERYGPLIIKSRAFIVYESTGLPRFIVSQDSDQEMLDESIESKLIYEYTFRK